MVFNCIRTFSGNRSGDAATEIYILKRERQFLSVSRATGRVQLWDLDTGACIRKYQGLPFQRAVHSLTVFDDCDSFLVGCDDRLFSFKISEATREAPIRAGGTIHWMGKFDKTRFLSLQNEGQTFTLRLRSLATREHLRMVRGDFGQFPCVSVLDQERALFVDKLGRPMVWNIDTNCVQTPFNWNSIHGVTSVSLIDSDRVMFCIEEHGGKRLRLFSIGNGDCIRVFDMPQSYHRSVITIPIGRERFLCGPTLGDLRRYDIQGGNSVPAFMMVDKYLFSCLSQLDDAHFLCSSWDGSFSVWEWSRWPVLKPLILMRALESKGRATRMIRKAKRFRPNVATPTRHAFLQDFICQLPDDVFRHVLSYID